MVLFASARRARPHSPRRGGNARRIAALAVTSMVSMGLSAALSTPPAHADETYPGGGVVKIIVGFPAGTAPDTLARFLADRFKAAFGSPVIVEPAVGAAGNIAADRVARSAPDGHTLLLSGNATLVVNQNLYAKLPFDPDKDFVPVSQVAITPNVLAVYPGLPVKSVDDLVTYARAHPDELTYAHVGIGTSQHFAGELFKQTAHVSIRAIPYRGGNAIYPDLITGRINLCFCNLATALPLIRDGKLRGLAVTSLQASPSAPDLPTMDKSGFPGFHADAWFGLVAPAGTPASIIAKLHAETAKALADPALRKTLIELGMVPVGNSPEEFAAVIKAETPYWDKLIKALALKVE
jgi:tripartite-type tricarboxylate transporter receptor subunit TctC